MIRKIKLDDTQEVSKVAVSAFMQSVAGHLSDEGVATFMSIASSESFENRMDKDNLMFVSEDAEGINGIVELKEGRHIAMLFVAPEKQGIGIGRELIKEALKYGRDKSVTVSASLTSVNAYEKYGFETVGPEEEKQGLRYRPMKIELNRVAKGL